MYLGLLGMWIARIQYKGHLKEINLQLTTDEADALTLDNKKLKWYNKDKPTTTFLLLEYIKPGYVVIRVYTNKFNDVYLLVEKKNLESIDFKSEAKKVYNGAFNNEKDIKIKKINYVARSKRVSKDEAKAWANK